MGPLTVMGGDRDQLCVNLVLRDLCLKYSPFPEDKKAFLNQLIETVELNFLANKFRLFFHLATFHCEVCENCFNLYKVIMQPCFAIMS